MQRSPGIHRSRYSSNTFVQRFEQNVRKRPAAPAVLGHDLDLSYAQLDALSAALARDLMSYGASKGCYVPFCFEKSALALVTILAIMRSGAAFVPIHPSQPDAQKRAVVEACDASLVVCSPLHHEDVQALTSRTLVVSAEALQASPQSRAEPALPFVSEDQVAYVLFTSGTTGAPKGVVVEHGNLSSICDSLVVHFRVTQDSRVLQWSSFVFDISIFDLLTLTVGGCICVPSEEERHDDTEGAVQRMRVNWAMLTPAVAQLLDPLKMPCLKTAVIGGDMLTASLISRWSRHLTLFCGYGPTETTIGFATTDVLSSDWEPTNIGWPRVGQAYVVCPDDHDILITTTDEVGELVVEGPSVARGYLNDPIRTDSVFFSRPKWLSKSHPPTRFYKTGDLVRRNLDNSFTILGRKDQQVKIRGQRVDLNSITHRAMLSAKRFTQVLPYFRNTPSGGFRHSLVVFFTSQDTQNAIKGSDNTVSELFESDREDVKRVHESLSATLSSYMIPSLFIPVHAIPLNQAGKPDRQKLETILSELSEAQINAFSAASPRRQYIEPSTPLEHRLQSMWAILLGVDPSTVSSTDHFVSIGGDSMKAMHLVSIARQEGIILSFLDIMTTPTLRDLAAKAEDPAPLVASQLIEPFSMLQDEPGVVVKAAGLCGVEVDLVEDCLPCTPLQEGLIIQSSRHSNTYVSQNVYRVARNTDLRHLLKSWEQTVEDMSILRTRIPVLATVGPLQVVIHENIAWGEANDLEEYLTQDKLAPMTPGQPLSRFAIVRAVAATYLVWTAHHALYDLFTIQMCLKRVLAYYRCSEPSPVKEFKHFVSHVRRQPTEETVKYWRMLLQNTDLPTWPPLPPSADGVMHLASATRLSPIRPSTSPFTLPVYIKAAFALAIATYADTQDVVFGVTTSGRDTDMPEISEIAGPTLTTFPMRVSFEPDSEIQEFLRSVDSATHAAIPHQHLGLQYIKRLSESASVASKLRTLLVIQPNSTSTLSSQGSAMETDFQNSAEESVGSYPLTVECQIQDDQLRFNAEYSEHSMDYVDPFLSTFSELIDQLRFCPNEAPIKNLILKARPSTGLKHTQLKCEAAPTSEDCIHDIILRMCETAPTKEAVLGWDGSLTYQDLDMLSAKLALHLQQSIGVKADTMVPICSDKSIWTIVAILGILRAGGAFVPLDSGTPRARHIEIIAQFKPKVVLASPAQSEDWKAFVGDVVELGPSLRNLELPPGADPTLHSFARPESLAYCIFTSGTTGKPKGVQIEHRAFVTGALARAARIHRNSESRVFQFSSFSFDTSVEDICTTLMVGGTVAVPSESERKGDIIGAMNRFRVNCADLTPSVASLFAPHQVPTLSTLIIGGEPPTKELVATWASVSVINTYGPAECSVVSTLTQIKTDDVLNIGTAPCGTAWVVNPHNPDILTPIGGVGELLMEGPTLARGYLNDRIATEASFVCNLAWADAEKRFYKTGDLVRLNTDSSLSFVRRKDLQVKLRGNRIELPEIESKCLFVAAAGDFKDVSVIVFEVDQRQALIAFMVPCQSYGVTVEIITLSAALRNSFLQLSRRLQSILPHYMVPAIFVPVSTLPTTVSGKRDRRALASLADNMSGEELQSYRITESSVNQSTKVQSVAAEISLRSYWAEILSISPASIDDHSNFFTLGADSLSAMRLCAMMKENGFELDFSDVFRQPTLYSMTLAIRKRQSKAQTWSTTPARFSLLGDWKSIAGTLTRLEEHFPETEIEDVYHCTPWQEGVLALSSKQEGAYVANHTFDVSPSIDIERLRAACDRLILSNSILRTKIVYLENQGSFQVVSAGIEPCRVFESATELETYLGELPMGYGQPLSFFAICHQSSHSTGGPRLTWRAHHAVFDGVTVQLLLRQLEKTYNAEELPISSFSRFTAKLRDNCAGDAKSYWQTALHGYESTESFLVQSASSGKIRKERRISLSTELSYPDNRVDRNPEVTLATVVRAAWSIVLSSYLAVDDIVLGVTLSGRDIDLDEISTITGPCVTTVPVRVKISKGDLVRSLLQRLQSQVIDMIPHQHYGLQLIKEINARACAFESILVVQADEGDSTLHGNCFLTNAGASCDVESVGYYTHPLVLEVTVKDDGVALNATFDENLVPHPESMLDCFSCVLQQLLVSGPTTAVRDISLCGSGDQSRLQTWNGRTPIAETEVIPAMISRTANAQPSSMAIEAWDKQLTYHELEMMSSALAAHLTTRLGPSGRSSNIIPICMSRSAWAPVAMLAVQKAGFAYAALDPSQPTARLRAMCEQVSAQAVLTQPGLNEPFLAVDTIITIENAFIDGILKSRSAASVVLPHLRPSDPAIVVFTSGSTGAPKPIVLQHHALATAARDFGPRMDFSSSSRVLQNAAFAFDIHAYEIFLTLVYGGCLVVSLDEKSQLAQTITRCNINWLFSTPSALQLLDGPQQIPGLKTLMMIGEAPTKAIYENWFNKSLHLINAYGPAENTLATSMVSITGPEYDPRIIGRGISTLTWIVDPYNMEKLLPIGAVGELVLEGPQLALEYYGQTDATRCSFFESPAWSTTLGPSNSGRRFYKTGDLVQYQKNGNLLILGRKDAQTKLNGQRLELGEVEYYLTKFLATYHVVADVLRANSKDSLVAFVKKGQRNESSEETSKTLEFKKISPKELPTFLEAQRKTAEQLPSFMVPSIFVEVSNIPLTSSGKLDRRRLRQSCTDVLVSPSTYWLGQAARKRTPQTNTQKLLQRLWASVLKIPLESVGAADNFFSIGGDSIRAIQITALIAQEWMGPRPRVSDIFLTPCLADFANALDSRVQSVRESKKAKPCPELKTDTDRDDLIRDLAERLGIHADDVLDTYPCTPLQEGMLTVSAQSKNAYYAENVWQLSPSVDLTRLEEAWRCVISAFDILRTRMVAHDRLGMLQVVVNIDQAFNGFCRGPDKNELSKFRLVENNSGTKLVWTAHHALFDGWTLASIAEQVQRAYDSIPLSSFVQFGDFIGHIATQNSPPAGEFWRKYLKGVTVTAFPDRKLVNRASSEHEKLGIEAHVAPTSATTAANVVRAAWSIVVSDYSLSNDIVYGETLSGRNLDMADIEKVLGPTITTIPFRVHVDRDQAVQTYLDSVQRNAVSMMQYEHMGLQNIRKVSDDAALACEFQSLLIIQPSFRGEVGGIMRPVHDRATTSRYHTLPLVVECTINENCAFLEATFDSGSITSSQMRRILLQFAHVMHELSNADPRGRLGNLNFLSHADKEQIKDWNSAEADIEEECIHDVISRQTTLRPSAQAVCSHDGEFTYAELDDLSDRLCKHLHLYGVGRGDIIPLCFEKSRWPMVAMMGVLKSGGAFAPTDPSHPPERLQQIVDQLKPKVILVSPVTSHIAFRSNAKMIELTANCAFLEPMAGKTPHKVSPDDLAYIIFTSGSTGVPKGVMISHKSFCSGVKPRDVALGRSEKSRVLQFASFSFDTSLEDTLTTWMFGGCTCIPSEHERLNDLEHAIRRMSVNCAHITPSLANALSPTSVPTLRQLRLGGERMTAGHLQTWTLDPGFDLRNVYGPTECSITTSGTLQLAASADPSNIGFPVACTVWIADAHNHDRLTPIGCIGEILVEGPIVADGYLNNPEKTAESFITDPAWTKDFGGSDGRRFYKTGDVAKYADDGSLVFVGRKDSQVKLNGNRIETGDVETHLRGALPSCCDSAVEILTPNGANRTSMLVAFVSINDGFDSSEDDLARATQRTRENLTQALQGVPEKMRTSLPTFMVPTAFVPLRSMPRSTAGKTDRKRLRQLVEGLDATQLRSFAQSQSKKRVPDTVLEIQMQTLWATVLQLKNEAVMATDSFLGLGGDSILALRLVSAARKINLFFSVADLLQASSLAELVQSLSAAHTSTLDPPTTASPTVDTPRSSQVGDIESLWDHIAEKLHVSRDRIEQVEKATGLQSETFAQSLLAEKGYINDFKFKFDGPVDSHAMGYACEVLVSRQTALRTVFTYQDGSLYQVVMRYRLPARPRLSVFKGEDAVPSRATGGLGGELVSFSLLDSATPTLVISISHALYDGPSHSLLCSELVAAYAGEELPDPSHQFISLSSQLPVGSPDSQNFWRSTMHGSSMTEIVTQKGPSYKNVVADYLDVAIDYTGSNLKTHGVTFASLLKSAWALVLAQCAGSHDVVFGQVVSIRELMPSLSNDCFGPCIECVPVRVRMDGETKALDLVRSVQSQHIEAMGHCAFGFRNIVSKCTEWPRWTRFSSVVQHQNLETTVSLLNFNDTLKAKAEVHAVPSDTADIWVLSTPSGPENVDVKIFYCKEVLPKAMVKTLLHQLTMEIHRLSFAMATQQETGEILHVTPVLSSSAMLPRPNPGWAPPTKGFHAEPSCEDAGQSREEVVEAAWAAFLDGTGVNTAIIGVNLPFWELSSEEPIVLAAVLSEAYVAKGYDVSVEMVLEAPTKALQAEYMSR